MIHKIKAIILHTIKYTDNSLIVYAYTNKFGRQTYIVNYSHSAKSKNRATLFQPLFLLDIEASNKQKSNMQRIKEHKLSEPLTFAFDIKKASIAMFIAEVLYKIIREEEPNEKMFDFIFNSILIFDKIEKGAENFHLHFLANLSKHIGFHPDAKTFDINGFFDIKSGQITSLRPQHPLHFDSKNTQILQQLLQIQVSNIDQIELNHTQRENFLTAILDFYNYHFDKLSPINSLKVFTELFNS